MTTIATIKFITVIKLIKINTNLKNKIMTKTIKNSNNQIIALKLNKFRVEAIYYVGYGANLRKLRGVPKKSAVVLATNEDRAIEIASKVYDIKETGSLGAGYIVKATRIKY